MKEKIEEQYKWIEDEVTYNLSRPDTILGSVTKQEIETHILNNNKLVPKTVNSTPALFHIFNEIISNSVDEHIRHGKITQIKVKLNTPTGEISIWDDGGIPVIIHKQYNLYIPDMIFSKLRSGSNLDDTKQRSVIGRNGVGSSAVNIFSTKFTVKTADGINQFTQIHSENSRKKTKPKIIKSNKHFTEIKFIPDYVRFNYTKIDKDLIHLIRKKIIDITATNNALKVSLQIDKEIEKYQFKSFSDYCNLYDSVNSNIISDDSKDWNIAIGLSKKNFQFTSFVNGTNIPDGGEHVKYIEQQIVNWLRDKIEKKYKVKISPFNIRQHLFLFVNATIINPSFGGQTKHELTTKPNDFGTTHIVSEKFLNKLFKSDIIENIIAWAKNKEEFNKQQEIKKQNRGLQKLNIEKLKDATSKNRDECEIFISEGDSASVGANKHRNRKTQAIFTLRGKVANVRKIKNEIDIYKNKELKNLMSAIGLKIGQPATNLRYSKINIMTDSDGDGDSISSLLVNFLYTYWSELFVGGKVFKILTPYLVAKQNKEVKEFYSELEYRTWFNSLVNPQKWQFFFKKGLAALEDREFSKIIKNPKKIQLIPDNDSGGLMEIWFGKDPSPRKKLISTTFSDGVIYNTSERSVSEYLRNEYLSYAYYVIEQRSIPSFIDGFKPVQRKIISEGQDLWKNNNKDLKVFMYAGRIAYSKKYHHGNSSLEGAIINMAQRFKNNLPLLDDIGQYGTLYEPFAGASRYISTKFNESFNLIYKDNNLLTYKYDEGDKIEPNFFLPIIPMVLINGSSGIAVGLATNILNRQPKDIINACLNVLNDKKIEINKIKPYQSEFTNNIQTTQIDVNKWQYLGKIIKKNTSTVTINEITPNWQYEKYDLFLNDLVTNRKITSYDNNCSNKTEYTIKFTRNELDKYTDEDLIKLLRLRSYETENLNTLDEHGKLKHFDSVVDIIKYFVAFRLPYYQKRKDLTLVDLETKITNYSNKVNFINGIIKGTIKVNKVAKSKIIIQLEKLKFDKINDSYSYLLSLPIYNLTKEVIKELNDKLKYAKSEIKGIKKLTPKQMYIDDLNELKNNLK